MSDLIYNKYICKCCGKTSIATSTEDIVKYDKKCTKCFIISIVGEENYVIDKNIHRNDNTKPHVPRMILDLDNPTNLRRDIGKNKKSKYKKILSPKEKSLVRQREEEKWERIRAGYRTLES